MQYCDLEDIKQIVTENTLIQLTDDDQTGVIDSDKVNDAIAYSQEVIDGFLRGRYELPLTKVPGVIKILSTDLSFYRLYSRRFDTEMPEAVHDKYKTSLKILTQIQKGHVLLDLDSPDQVPVLPGFKTNKRYEDKMFSRRRLHEY